MMHHIHPWGADKSGIQHIKHIGVQHDGVDVLAGGHHRNDKDCHNHAYLAEFPVQNGHREAGGDASNISQVELVPRGAVKNNELGDLNDGQLQISHHGDGNANDVDRMLIDNDGEQ